MSILKLPTSLERKPLAEASFHVRLSSAISLADILPSFLFCTLDLKPVVKRQPAAEIPLIMRANGQNLHFVPTFRFSR